VIAHKTRSTLCDSVREQLIDEATTGRLVSIKAARHLRRCHDCLASREVLVKMSPTELSLVVFVEALSHAAR
jgi:hypothetical protein